MKDEQLRESYKLHYSKFHRKVAQARGKPKKCERCQTTTAKRYEWASLTKHYENINDYIRLCVSCHRKMDYPNGEYTFRPMKPRKCDVCGGMFTPRAALQKRCGSIHAKGTCAHKFFNEYHRLRNARLSKIKYATH